MDIRLNTLSVFMAHELDFSWVKIVTVIYVNDLAGNTTIDRFLYADDFKLIALPPESKQLPFKAPYPLVPNGPRV